MKFIKNIANDILFQNAPLMDSLTFLFFNSNKTSHTSVALRTSRCELGTTRKHPKILRHDTLKVRGGTESKFRALHCSEGQKTL